MYREMKKEELTKNHLKKLGKRLSLKEDGENFKERLQETTKILLDYITPFIKQVIYISFY